MRLDAGERARQAPLAVVGLACRFPGAPDAARYWQLLREGGDAITEVPAGRWNVEDYYALDPAAEAKMYTRRGGFLGAVDGFDPSFFAIAPRETISMDPQQRLLLEVAWEAIENAGIPAHRLFGTPTGVFLGICNNDYGQRIARQNVASIDAYCGTGVAFSVAAGRLSYALGLQGPSMAVDTACSSSLAALDLAAQNLRSGGCGVAVVGGVNLILNPEGTIYFCKVRALAPDGRCKTFDDRADGYGRGEGCGVVVLKRLDDALRDGDRIRAVLRGSAVNHDGRSNGLTAPNGLAQEAVIKAALANAGVDPRDVSYVEAHGTGTPLGDPIELRALDRAYGQGRAATEKLRVGSAKANIGHLEAAAGMAGLIKLVLALEQGEIPQQPHFETPTRHVDWSALSLTVEKGGSDWKDARRLAGISAFGFSGTNVHAILESAPTPAPAVRRRRAVELLPISGRTPSAVRTLAARHAEQLRLQGPAAAADLAFTAATGRVHFPYRAAVVAAPDALAAQLDAVAQGAADVRLAQGAAEGIAFLFTGQGAQHAGMAQDLYADEPVFAETIDRCADAFRDASGGDLQSVLWGEDAPARIDRTEFTQPALYAVQCALTALWRRWGIVPAAVIGHSVGEFAAAQAAGIFSLEDGMRLVSARGRLMQALGDGGAMAAVFASEARLADVLGSLPQGVAIAAVNAPEEIVLSSFDAALLPALAQLEARGIATRRLTVSHGFHSPQLDPMLDAFEAVAADIAVTAPLIPLISNLTGEALTDAPDAAYWRRHAREPVRFADALGTLAETHRIFLELGPQPLLLAMGRRALGDRAGDRLWLPSLRRGTNDVQQMLESLADLHLHGAPVDWAAFAEGRGDRIDIATYPFERQRYWLDEPAPNTAPVSERPRPAPEAGEAQGTFATALMAMPAKDRLDRLIDHLQGEVRRVLRLASPPPIDTGFFELGMDSLMAVELRVAIEAALGRPLSATLAFDQPDIRRLSQYLLQELGGERPSAPAAIGGAAAQEPIAVVGIGCRFPGGANDPEAFWRLILAGGMTATPVPSDRWDADQGYDPDPDTAKGSYCRTANFLDTPVDGFDAAFFSITPREATAMDPQQRLLLEVAWEALEHAGMGRRRGGRGGVFVGINTNDYARLLARETDATLDGYSFTGNTFSVAAGRLSHLLGIDGPSLAVDTACSSSLVAVHLACQSLQAGECAFALAGGVNLMLAPDAFTALSRMRALAPDGRCKTFDAAADGYGRGEGCGVVILKRLSDAEAAGDDILGVIHGSAVNQDGASGGLTVPNGPAQQALIGQALARAGIAAADIGYLEAHGTGTALGDPIEVTAAGQALGDGRPSGQKLLLGSVKRNIGHLEAAAGVAGLIKTILSMRHGIIPGHPGLGTLNPRIAWDRLPVQVPREAMPWPAGQRFAGISSFGMSGTNAHVILGQGTVLPGDAHDPQAASAPLVVPVSGRSAEAVAALAEHHAACLEDGHVSARALAYTAGVGRTHFEHRLAVVASDPTQLGERLRHAHAGGSGPGIHRGAASSATRPHIAFLFTGQGAQYAGMGRALYASEPVFRSALERCDAILRDALDVPLLSILYGEHAGRIDQTAYTQPALFALEYALSALWRSWGIEPSIVLGHSVGEYVAACVAGVFDVEDGIKLIAARARAMQALPAGGGMAAVRAAPERIAGLLAARQGQLWLAAENGPEDLVVSGEEAALAALCAQLEAQGIATQTLRVSHAFHSGLMAPAAEALRQVADTITFRPPQLRLIRDMDGMLAEEPLDAAYWTRHLLQPVRFAAALDCLAAQAPTALVEIGPQPVLTTLAQGHALRLPSLRRQRDDGETMQDSLAALYAAGVEVDWQAVHQPHQPRKAHIPTYPFQRKRYWALGPAVATPAKAPVATFHHLQWQARAASTEERPETAPRHWLVFAGRDPIGAALVDALHARGDRCTIVRSPGDPGAADHRIDPAAADAMEALIRALLAAGGCSAIVYLWALDAQARLDDPMCGTGAESVLGPLHLVQGILRAASAEPPRLWFVTRGAQPVEEGSEVALAQAPLWGLGRVVALEHPELWGGLVDLDPRASDADAARLGQRLRAADREDLVALRGEEVLVPRVVSASAPARLAAPEIRADAAYLVTGGLGSLGFAVARWLIGAGARDLILVGRRAPSAETAAEIAAFAERGVRIAIATIDVADRQAVDQLFARIAAAHAPLRGVVHAAGVLDDGAVLAQTAARFAQVLTPKVAGGWNLHRATRQMALDFFLLFSSAATLIGSPGQANYVAANAFLDALAHHRRAQGLAGAAIGWGPWREIGMAADLARRAARRHVPPGVSAIDPERGLAMLGHLLADAPAQVTAMPVDWPAFLAAFDPAERPRALADIAAASGVDAHRVRAETPRSDILDRLSAARPDERQSLLADFLLAELAQVIGDGDAPPDPGMGFFDIGLDSLMAVELKNRLGAALRRPLPATLIFRFANVRALAAHLADEVLVFDDPVAPAPAMFAEEDDALDHTSEDMLLALLAQELGRSPQLVNGDAQ
ncbi:type I polyketide synthase [Sphingomonas sp. TDK1]|uniref:type I polyketide synthase n=1 Tax=Sphingomonas sp. TDK1 TaxID=453247 RepID=UPI000A4B2DB8|nr:type I polyketide synthase [Sphingomonas sp. TDK1]